ncbi:RloB family protein [Burkholderia vietnamiensis]|uniref:RloB family protein n=1 Tax=Burkholderia vietnamiensis TaxID=60552 RepID=UPI001CF2B80C|nr:RloB family protein [Burkholderia vietnamiensis]MCA8267830.1 RloB family protein [Burkholderia vietnamiensis]UKV77325.1 RloB family protein [Burkholderia vietnamiensis]
MKLPAAPTLQRRTGFVSPKVEIVIACEGRVTEKHYFESCKLEYGVGMVKLRWLPITGVPMTVVTAAVEEREALIEKARKSKDSFDVFRVWAIFDRDAHPEVPEALQLARSNGVDVAFSDPCFELWPLLHVNDYGAQFDRHKVQALLHDLMPSYHHDKSPVVDFDAIKNNFPDAYRRANALNKSRSDEGIPDGCPSTTVGVLVKKIIENGRTAFVRQTGCANN